MEPGQASMETRWSGDFANSSNPLAPAIYQPANFDARLASLHARLLGEDANAAAIVEHRRAATKAYANLTSGTDRHYNLE